MASVSKNPVCATVNELMKSGFYKRKYAAYSVYLSTITSCPFLHRVGTDAEIRNSVISKAANIIAMKVIDNLNDSYHSPQRALHSLSRHRDSLVVPIFSEYNDPKQFVDEAENTAFLIARWIHEFTWKELSPTSYCFRLFKASVDRYVRSQIESLKQKTCAGFTDNLSLRYYFEKIATKGDYGNMWLDIDFANIERRVGINYNIRSIVRDLKIGSELFARSLLLYDDVCDFDDDLRDGVVNSAALYALEAGYLNRSDLRDVQQLRMKVNRSAMEDVVGLGDLLFAKAIEHFDRARSHSDGLFDIDAYIFSSRITRIFVMRRWAFRKRKLTGLRFSLRSFYDNMDLRTSIPDRILSYGEDLLSSTEPYIELIV